MKLDIEKAEFTEEFKRYVWHYGIPNDVPVKKISVEDFTPEDWEQINADFEEWIQHHQDI